MSNNVYTRINHFNIIHWLNLIVRAQQKSSLSVLIEDESSVDLNVYIEQQV